MADVKKLTVKIDVKAGDSANKLKKLDKATGSVSSGVIKIDNNAKQASKSVSGLNKKLGTAGNAFKALGGIAVAAFIGNIANKSVELASTLEEAKNKFDVTFGKSVPLAEQNLKTLTKQFGFSRIEATKLLANTGDMLTGFGMTGDQALALSFDVQKLAGDLSSFNNIPVEQASAALTSGLLGEREAMKSLGIVIREDDIKQRLLAQGMNKLTGNALLQAKAMITLQIAQEQSKNAAGDFERSMNSYANQQKIYTNNLQELQLMLGQKLLPIFNLFTKVLIFIMPLLSNYAILLPVLTAAFGLLVVAVWAMVTAAWALVAPVWAVMLPFLPLILIFFAIIAVIGLVVEYWDELVGAFKAAWVWVKSVGSGFLALFGGGDKKISLEKKETTEQKAVRTGETSVNDAIITKDGRVINTHPDDNIIATKADPTAGGMGMGGGVNLSFGNIIINTKDSNSLPGDFRAAVKKALDDLVSDFRSEAVMA